MRAVWLGAVMAMAACGAMSLPAQACGDAESGLSCGDGGSADDARWMLKRVVAAVTRDEPQALDAFTHGTNGFRTMDLYVFCVRTTDGVMDAHPNPDLLGRDARGLVDPNGKHFIVDMLDHAEEGRVAEIQYLFPKLGSTVPVPKTSFVTRVQDQVCGVGTYE